MAEKKITMHQKNELGALDTLYPKTVADQVVESEQKKFITDVQTKQYEENTLYTNETPIVEGIGSVEVGETFTKVPVNEMLTKILYPYIKPTIYASATPGSKVVEKGVTTTVTGVTANVGKKSKAITNVELFNNGSSVEAKAEGVQVGGAIKFTNPIQITDTATLTVKASDGKSTVQATAASYTYVYPYYHGVAASQAQPSASAILAMTKEVVTKGTKTFTYDMTGQCAVVAFPKAYGKLTKALDANGFDNIKSFKEYTVSITGTDKKPVDYYVYVKAAATAKGFALTYSH